MYRKTEQQVTFEDFYLPFGGKLRSDNRWVKLSKLIPWHVIEEKYAAHFAQSGMGAPAKPVRMALGALIIKEKCRYSDEETVEQIRENPYLQYFIGLTEYQDEAPFDPSMMVHFRKRIKLETINEINELIIPKPQEKTKPATKDNDHDTPGGSGDNKGQLILDATCSPADIRYPTDLSLLNEAREKLENIIDALHEPSKGETKKPRTYRKTARRDYLKIAKQRRPKPKMLRKAIGKQLRYVRRDLGLIARLLETVPVSHLNRKQQRELETIRKLYQQQKSMYDQQIHRVDDRIVSITQPHVRPIVRGKAGAETEFGAKLSISLTGGYARLERCSWDNFNEGSTLIEQVEAYQQRCGYYPKAVLVDQIYRTRENRMYCKAKGIHLSGPPLGRPRVEETKAQKRQAYKESCARNAVEGKLGEGKRRYGLGLIMAKLKETSETVIALQFLVMNLEARLRFLFYRFLQTWFIRPVYPAC